MKTVKFEIMMEVEDGAIDNIKKLEHHADYLLDLYSYPEIHTIHDCKVTVVEESEK